MVEVWSGEEPPQHVGNQRQCIRRKTEEFGRSRRRLRIRDVPASSGRTDGGDDGDDGEELTDAEALTESSDQEVDQC